MTVVKVKGKGSIGVNTKKGKKLIGNVLFNSELDQSLLGVLQLLKHGYVLRFEGNGSKIYDQGKKNVMVEVKMGSYRSFSLTFKYSRDVSIKTTAIDESWLWQKKLSHLNFEILKLLHIKNIVQGLLSIEENNEVYDGCTLGRHHRQSFF